MKKRLVFVLVFLVCAGKFSIAQSLYFPPINSSANWDTVSPTALGWCTNRIGDLYDFLQLENTKGFIVLKNGKIVLEKYFGTFTKDSTWYWASAGKTITALLIGKAQEENLLSLDDKSSNYLGVGWTSCIAAQEDKITIRNQLTMTTGLDDGVPDNHCTAKSCLTYLADAGSRWAYHNAPYTLLESILETATGLHLNNFTQLGLRNKTGITGLWVTVDFDNVFFSKVRSMARFDLLIQNNCVWNTDTLLYDKEYIRQMTSTSQYLNLSYGYLWWLNGKASYMLPTTQIIIPGSYAPNAPPDMIAGLGKNGQIVSISKSKGIVMVRMGNRTNNAEVTTQLCDQIWEKLNAMMCDETSVEEPKTKQNGFSAYPNPAGTKITITLSSTDSFQVDISDIAGKVIISKSNQKILDLSNLKKGIYIITLVQGKSRFTQKFIKN